MTECPEHTKLQEELGNILEKLAELTAAQLKAFQADDHQAFMRFDREVEKTIGIKERRVGALRQHRADHKCQP